MDVVEIWRDVPGYEGLYRMRVGDCAIRSELRETATGTKGGGIIRAYIGEDGYKRISLSRGGKNHPHLLHRLIAETFIPNPENKPCIDHINGDRSDNRVDNLRWCSHKENNNNPITKSRQILSHIGHRGKLSYQSKAIICIESNKMYWGTKEAQRSLGVCAANIRKALKNERGYAGGYHWRYATSEEIEKELEPTVKER